MLFLGFISGKIIQFQGKWAKTFENPGSLTSTQTHVPASPVTETNPGRLKTRYPPNRSQLHGNLFPNSDT